MLKHTSSTLNIVAVIIVVLTYFLTESPVIIYSVALIICAFLAVIYWDISYMIPATGILAFGISSYAGAGTIFCFVTACIVVFVVTLLTENFFRKAANS